MHDNKKIVVPYCDFPASSVTNEEKSDTEFGLKVGKAIQSEWFRTDSGTNPRFFDRFTEFNKLRMYARGEQPVQQYKDELAIDGDLSYMNIDWSPVPVIPKFVDIVVNGMSDREFKPKARAQDALSKTKRVQYQDLIQGQMLAKPILENIQQKTGINPFTMNPEDLPSGDEELNLHMQLDYKPAIEIAEETAISTIFEDNNFETIRAEIDEDQVILGLSVAKHDFLKGKGLVLKRVDPAMWLHSYTEDRYFRDCYYFGHVETVHISELKAINPELGDDDIKDIQKTAGRWYHTMNLAKLYGAPFNEDVVDILNFSYKTTEMRVYKRKKTKNGVKYIEKDESFDPEMNSWEEFGYDREDREIEVWYEGVMILGSDRIIKWEKEANMVRPKSALEKTVPKYVACASRMYKGRMDSLVKRMIPFTNLIQITHYKIQQVIQRTVPDGIFLDADGVNEVDLGNGNAYNPSEAIKLYFQTGSVVGRSYTQDGDMNRGKVPIEELTKSTSTGKLQMLIQSFNYYMDMIRNVTGLNEARDASTPDSRSLVGIQKLAALNSNTATRHILEAGLWVTKRLAEAACIRISDILEYSDLAEAFANQIGRNNFQIINEIRDLYIYDFGIYIEVSPDAEEKQRLEEDIKIALSNKEITVDDKIDIQEIKNIKLASQLLKLRRKKREKQMHDMQMEKDAMNQQFQLQAQKMATDKVIMEIREKSKAESSVERSKSTFRILEKREEAKEKKALMREEFIYQMRLKGMTDKQARELAMEKEDRKDKRLNKQSTQQSKLIEQRQKNTMPINFESNEDSLDGFGLEEFSPR